MRVKTSPSDRAARVDLVGELDMASADLLRQLLLAVTVERDLVVLNLTGVRFLDSTALGVVMAAWRRLRARDGALVVVDPQPEVVRVLQATGLTRHLLLEEVHLPDELLPELQALEVHS